MNPILDNMQTGRNLRNHRHGLDTSADFAVEVDGEEVFVERYHAVNLASFPCRGPVGVRVRCRREAPAWRLLPRHRAPSAEQEPGALVFRLEGPRKLWVEADDLDPLLLFAEPPETDAPRAGESGVRFFGPGKHCPGMMELHDGETIYLAEGAYVYGGIRGSPRKARIVGRGVLDGICLARPDRPLELTDAEDVLIEGLAIRNGPGWTCKVLGGERIVFRNVKVLSFGRNGDGIDPVSCRDVLIENCFFRCADDCIAAKMESRPGRPADLTGLTVRGCVLGGWLFADGFTIGFCDVPAAVRDVLVQDCDVLYARGNSGVEGHSAFSVILTGHTEVSNVRFENIRVEADVCKNLELTATGHTGKYFSAEQRRAEGGRIRGVHLKGIAWAAERPIVLRGHDVGHMVEDVTFENCTVAGRNLTSVERPFFEANEYVGGVRFVGR